MFKEFEIDDGARYRFYLTDNNRGEPMLEMNSEDDDELFMFGDEIPDLIKFLQDGMKEIADNRKAGEYDNGN